MSFRKFMVLGMSFKCMIPNKIANNKRFPFSLVKSLLDEQRVSVGCQQMAV